MGARAYKNNYAQVLSDLAALYGVETKVLNQAVRRHERRFPEDFMFQLSNDEADVLRSQFVTSKKGERRGGRLKRAGVHGQENSDASWALMNTPDVRDIATIRA